jgi:hypothetical protein
MLVELNDCFKKDTRLTRTVLASAQLVYLKAVSLTQIHLFESWLLVRMDGANHSAEITRQ